MAANTDPIFEKTALVAGVQFVNGDGTAKKTLLAAADIPSEGLRVDQIAVSYGGTGTPDLGFWVTVGGTDYYIGNVRVAAGAGYTTVARQDAILTLAPTLGYLFLPDGADLKCAPASAVASETLDVVAFAGTFTA